MTHTLPKRYEHDRKIWEQCAATYERQIVHGHPDVTAYESFEHSFIERLVLYLTRDRSLPIHCYDFGCGSGRIHSLLAPFLFKTSSTTGSDSPEREGRLMHVGGIDFSKQMIEIARQNIINAGLHQLEPDFLSFDTGSAFDVPAYSGKYTPLAVTVCNSIGVMQGEEGACALFKTMNNYVKRKKGIALISCYCREAVESHALGNYESTMDVCGQPCWLTPDTYTSPEYTLLPNYYKRAHDPDPHIKVDVIDEGNNYIARNVTLSRDAEAVKQVIDTGNINTYCGYHSKWYSTDQIKEWMHEFWDDGMLWHIKGVQLDQLRGEPAQLALVDYSGEFESLAGTWGLSPLNR